MSLDANPVESPCRPGHHQPLYYTVTETAEITHYSNKHIYRCITEGRLDAYNPGGVGTQRVSCCAITAFMEGKPDGG